MWIYTHYHLQASRETVMCILDCFAHLLTTPEEIESAFLERATKAFTKVLCVILRCPEMVKWICLFTVVLSLDEKHRRWEERPQNHERGLEACSASFEVGCHERVWGLTHATITKLQLTTKRMSLSTSKTSSTHLLLQFLWLFLRSRFRWRIQHVIYSTNRLNYNCPICRS